MLRPNRRRRALVAAVLAAPAGLVFLPLSAADQCTDQANLVANFAAASAAHTDANGQSHDGLYFTAGPSDEIYGLYGRLTGANCTK